VVTINERKGMAISTLDSVDTSMMYCDLQAEFLDQLHHLNELASEMDSTGKCKKIIGLLNTMGVSQKVLMKFEKESEKHGEFR